MTAARPGGLARLARRGVIGVLAGAAIAIGAALAPAAPARAETALLFSFDGVSWSPSLRGSVFPTDQVLVPGDSIRGTFFVRNATSESRWIRVGLSQLIVTHEDLADSMEFTAVGSTFNGASGGTSTLGADGLVCTDLLDRTSPLPGGAIVRVDTTLGFRASVSGTTAQDEGAELHFIAELSEIDMNAAGAPLCDGSLTIGPIGTRSHPGGGSGDPGSDGGTGGSGSSGGSGRSGGDSGEASGAPSGPIAAPTTGSIGGGALLLEPSDGGDGGTGSRAGYNTVQWWEEYAILVLLGAALAGATTRLAAQRRWGETRETGGPR